MQECLTHTAKIGAVMSEVNAVPTYSTQLARVSLGRNMVELPLAASSSVSIKAQGAHPYTPRLPTIYHVEVKHLIPAFLHLLARRTGLGSLALAGSAAAVLPVLSCCVAALFAGA